ncbi:hypothetical protein EDB83DRAFT_2445938, partial [Lactarius deliciosus]
MQRNVDPSGGCVHTARRDGPSSALGASVARVAHRRGVRSACTSVSNGGRQPTHTSSEPRAPIRPRARISTLGASMSPSSFRVLPSAPNRAARCRPSYSVLAMRSVRRHSGWLEPSAAARPGLLSSTARCDAALGGTTCTAGGTPTKWGSMSKPRDACVGIVGGELERTVQRDRELHGGNEALRDAGKLVQA